MSCPMLPKLLMAALAAMFLAAGCSDKTESAASGTPGAPTGMPHAFNHPEITSVVSGRRLTVRVLLGQAMAGKVSPRDTVFIYARTPEENGQVVALVKRLASELPLTVTLDDAASLRPSLKLSSLPVVVLGARISKQGDFTPHTGDLEGISAPIPVTVKETVVVAVSRIR